MDGDFLMFFTEYQRDSQELLNYILQCNKNINEFSYIQNRGITDKNLLNFYLIGYDTESQLLILPYGNTATARSLGSTKNYFKLAGNDNTYFNEERIDDSDIIIITESIIDSLSIYQSFIDSFESGYINYKSYKVLTIGANGTENVSKIINLCNDKIILLNLDNDRAGQRELKNIINSNNTNNILLECKFNSIYKDTNERLIHEPTELIIDLKDNLDTAIKYLNDRFFNNRLSSVFNSLGIKETVYKTNFTEFNNLIDGGFYKNNLYTLGALSSLGKTTFLINIATQLAENKCKVLYISLETSKKTFLSKIISKLTYVNSLNNYQTDIYGKTARNYLNNRNIFKDTELKVIKQSEEYFMDKIDKYLYVDTDTRDIINLQSLVYKLEPDIVIIDYLQILNISIDKLTDKQKIDTILNKLVDLKKYLPVIVISSINRQNYLNTISLESFKESGNIEYSSDVVLGLEPYNLDSKTNQTAKDKNKNIIEATKLETESYLNLRVLKNREGGLGGQVYKFYKLFSYFEEVKNNEINK